MSEAVAKQVEETIASLRRVQDFDVATIGQRERLGGELNFEDAIPPVERTVALFREISPDVLADVSKPFRDRVRQQADALFNRLEQIRTFSASAPNPKQTRDGFVQELISSYDQTFEQLWPAIAYSIRRATDFSRMEHEARAAIQAISDRTSEAEEALKARQNEADAALEAIRKVAAEHGVSQQAIYFKEEADAHQEEAGRWLKRTSWLTVGLGAFATATLFLHKWSWLAPASPYEAAQLAIGKVLVFAAMTFFLILSARSYMAHRHNAIVNKHRQNSLVTYRALVEAAGDAANRDIILAKAAESIFASQGTAFAKSEGDDGRALSMVSVGASSLRSVGT